MSIPSTLTTDDTHFNFSWDLVLDRATLVSHHPAASVWNGSLLPLFWLTHNRLNLIAIKPSIDLARSALLDDRAELVLNLGGLGELTLSVKLDAGSVRFDRMEVNWTAPQIPEISAMYFGADVMTAVQRSAAPSLELPFWPSWRSEGFCVASAKTNPMQSFFRCWDFGHANIPLGSFGPAMGIPYAAAFPRPIYAACLGGKAGWVCMGCGSVPDGALTLQIRSKSGMLEWRYREDLWGGPTQRQRTWANPLWITWSTDAWQAYRRYFQFFPAAKKSAGHEKSFWGTWGDFRVDRFDIKSSIDRAIDEMEAALICVDDPWESSKGTCTPDLKRFPDFGNDIAYAHKRGVGVGIWMPMGWVADPAAAGLDKSDLLLSCDGAPIRATWSLDPHDVSHASYCLDPSSSRVRSFLRERTLRVIREYQPVLLKIDFGYGIPGPDACAPRDPDFRGEKLAWSYARVIADAAHELDPKITVLYYSLHPLWHSIQDQCSLDDLGDAGPNDIGGHGHWSIWAALLGERGQAIMGSSGYSWAADTDILLNSAILGAPGANLPRVLEDGSSIPPSAIARRRALFRWYRRTSTWRPLWLDSRAGSLEVNSVFENVGRVERFAQGEALTALALRNPSSLALAEPMLRGLTWNGRWAVLAQGESSIFDAQSTSLIPFDPGWICLPRAERPNKVFAVTATDRTLHDAWNWREGMLHIDASHEFVASEALGFTIQS